MKANILEKAISILAGVTYILKLPTHGIVFNMKINLLLGGFTYPKGHLPGNRGKLKPKNSCLSCASILQKSL